MTRPRLPELRKGTKCRHHTLADLKMKHQTGVVKRSSVLPTSVISVELAAASSVSTIFSFLRPVCHTTKFVTLRIWGVRDAIEGGAGNSFRSPFIIKTKGFDSVG